MSTNTPGTSTSFGPLKQVDAGVLTVGYAEARTIEGGVGHNLPQEAPDAFADAILEVGGRGR